MWVVTVDDNGKELGDGHWVDIPEPDKFNSNGFSRIESYVGSLLRSSAHFSSLIIATPDGQIAVSIFNRDGVPIIGLSVDWRLQPEQERAIREFFSQRELATFHDYLAGNGDVPDATRCLDFFLPSDGRYITALTKDLLRQIYKIQDQDSLHFTFQEHTDKK